VNVATVDEVVESDDVETDGYDDDKDDERQHYHDDYMEIYGAMNNEATSMYKALREWGKGTGHDIKKICWLCGEFSDPRQNVGHVARNCEFNGVCS
jgi:hypothetical protein